MTDDAMNSQMLRVEQHANDTYAEAVTMGMISDILDTERHSGRTLSDEEVGDLLNAERGDELLSVLQGMSPAGDYRPLTGELQFNRDEEYEEY